MQTLRNKKAMMTRTLGLTLALCFAAFFSPAQAQTASGRLQIYGYVQPSYYVEVTTEGYRAIAQGIAETNSLRAAVPAGQATVRVLKANSTSAAYALVIRGGEQEVRLANLPYGTAVPVSVPATLNGALPTMAVLPE